MTLLIMKGAAGADVDTLAKKLAAELGRAEAAEFPVLAKQGETVDDTFEAAIRRWQAGVGVIADGIVGPLCAMLLELAPPLRDEAFRETPLTVAALSRLFPATKPANIARYLPYLEAALATLDATDPALVLTALGSVRADAEGFVPIAAQGTDRWRGRGFLQLTGQAQYEALAAATGVPLAERPELASAPEVAALLLAHVLRVNAKAIRAAVSAGRLEEARAIVESASRGGASADHAALERFRSVFELAKAGWEPAAPAVGAGRGQDAADRRAALGAGKTKKDAADLRDRPFVPQAVSLPPVWPSAERVRDFLPLYAEAGLVLDQGREGACTGFGLACVVNYLRWVQAGNPTKDFQSVSPRMLYTLARRHDEYAGENYEGSSCRGAIKGWFNNGVCLASDWPYSPSRANPPRYGYAQRAAQNTLGVYYRVDTKTITDLQAAIAQHGAVFASAFTHEGWDLPAEQRPLKSHDDLPEIEFDGRPSQEGGHAFALVGYDARGFIVQNSWGRSFGAGGFAVLTYLDWLANAMDAWVVSLGVPGVVAGRLATGGAAAGGAGRAGGPDRSKWWDSGLAYQHSVVLGNDGRVARYLTEDEKPRKLQQQAFALPDQWFRSRPDGAPRRLVIYAHGGLNSEEAAIQRASAMGRFFVNNGCYPLFLVWKTGLMESLSNIVSEAARREPARAGAAEWLTDKSDLLIEKTLGRPFGRPLWSEMKENAELAFATRRGGELLLDALAALAEAWGSTFQIHLVGHSAGSIVLGHLLTSLRQRQGLARHLASVHLYAPACTVAFANRHYASDPQVMQQLHLDVLADKVERDDAVAGIYRKSLLYLVSNALEADLRTPILGLERIDQPGDAGWDGTSDTGETLAAWRLAAESAGLGARKTVLQADRIEVAHGPVMQRAAHGSFDNDLAVVTRTLERITGAALQARVDDLRGY